MNYKSIILMSAILTGCGSISTIPKSDFDISRNLRKAQTKCDELIRVYSGVAYDICRVHSREDDAIEAAFLGYYIFDTIPSFLIDTVALPYTIYQQVNSGNINIRSD